MKISTKTRYAVMAMADIANQEHDAVVSLQEIANRQGLPLAYLEQIFLSLRKANLVISTRGAQGGYKLSRAMNTIRIADIRYAIEPHVKATRCNEKESTGCQHSGKRCLTHDLWEDLTHVVHQYLSQVTLFDVVKGHVKQKKTQEMEGKGMYHVL